MKKNIIAFESFNGFNLHSENELQAINGGDGSGWGSLAWLVGRTARCIWEFSKTAIEYQHSLPPNLKK